MLELVYLLENAWIQSVGDEKNVLSGAKLYLASASGKSTMHHARRMLEWMDSGIQREFENQAAQGGRQAGSQEGRSGPKVAKAPFEFEFLKLMERKSQVNRALLREGPKVVVASDTSLEWGFSRFVLENIAAEDKNLIILTERNAPVSQSTSGFGKMLWDVWSQKAGVKDFDAVSQDPPSQAFNTAGAELQGKSVKIEQLAGNELTIYQQYLARQRQMQDTVNTEEPAIMDTAADVVDARSDSSSESEDDEDDEQQGKALNAATAMAHGKHKLGLSDAELGIDVLVRRKGHYDYDVRGRKGRERMYPILSKRNHRTDDYGDTIKSEDYLRAEERQDLVDDEAHGSASKKDAAVGEKRKWDEVGNEAVLNSKKLANGIGKRRKTDDAQGISMDGMQMNGDVESDTDEDEDEEEERVEGPVKAVSSSMTLSLSLKIAFVDFSGYHDKRSIHYLIPLIKPRKLILIGGEAKETAALATDCRQLLHLDTGSVDVSTPVIGAIVDASGRSN